MGLSGPLLPHVQKPQEQLWLSLVLSIFYSVFAQWSRRVSFGVF